MDLGPFIDLTASEILNAKGTLSDVFVTSTIESAANAALAGIISECDPQLLITLQFKEPVKLASIKFVSSQSGTKRFFTSGFSPSSLCPILTFFALF